MAYTVPTFNLLISHLRLHSPYDFATAVSVGSFYGQLRAFGRFQRPYHNAPANSGSGYEGITLLCPPGTDVRDHHCAGAPIDMVEAPSGSGRYYVIFAVDDVAKGFPNEYRCASLQKYSNSPVILHIPDWPAPIP